MIYYLTMIRYLISRSQNLTPTNISNMVDGSYLYSESIHLHTILYVFLLLFVVICLTVEYFLTDFCGELTAYGKISYLYCAILTFSVRAEEADEDESFCFITVRSTRKSL